MKRPALSELTLREKIGQTALGRLSSEGFLDLEKYPYGCLWGLGNVDMSVINMADREGEIVTNREKWIRDLEEVNKHLKVPILQAMDCTSGISGSFREIDPMFDPVTMGAANSEEIAYEAGRLRAKMLKCVGSRWVWSQEVDLPNRFSAINLGRLYSDDPDTLLRMNIADMRGCHDEGVAATAKHFPGTDGMEYRDAHTSDGMMLLPYEEWIRKQGRVFQGMIDAGVDAIMIAHHSFPFYDNTKRNGRYVPSTLSYKVITELLKGKMGFKGVVITDGIQMRSAASYCDDNWERVYVEAIKAGNDVVLDVRDIYFDAIEKAVLSGEIPEERIDDACQRVLDMKERYGFFEDDFQVAYGTPEEVNALAAQFREKAAQKAVSLVCDHRNILPLNKEKIKNVTIIYSGHDKTGSASTYDKLAEIKTSFAKRGAQVVLRRGLLNDKGASELRQIAEESDLIIYAGYLMRHEPQGYNGFYDDEVKTFHHALTFGVEKSIGLGLGSPFMYFDFYYSFPAFINAYNASAEMLEAVVAAMYGEIPFAGGEPFKLIPDNIRHYLELLEKSEG